LPGRRGDAGSGQHNAADGIEPAELTPKISTMIEGGRARLARSPLRVTRRSKP
jgi:hypothetical protein